MKYKKFFGKGYVPNWRKDVFVIQKVKSTVPWKYIISDLNNEEIAGTCKKTNQSSKIDKRKNDKHYVKWKRYKNPFSSCIDKKRSSYIAWVTFQNDMSIAKTK